MSNKQTFGARLVGLSEKQSSVTLLLFQLVQDNLYVLDVLRINTLCEVRPDRGKLPSRCLFRDLGHRNFISLNI
jgi:hypothetical protein